MKATPTHMIETILSSIQDAFSRPEKNEKMSTATGVNALSICMYETERYMYDLLDNTSETAKHSETGRIDVCITAASTFFCLNRQ